MAHALPMLALLVAMSKDRVIGHRGRLPWSLPEDLRLFRELTMGQTLIMGRKTYESLAGPLRGRQNLVLSSTMQPAAGITVCRSWEEALRRAGQLQREIWVIGGADVYRQALGSADQLVISWVEGDFAGDVLFPEVSEKDWELYGQTPHTGFIQCRYKRRAQRLDPPGTQSDALLCGPF